MGVWGGERSSGAKKRAIRIQAMPSGVGKWLTECMGGDGRDVFKVTS